MDDPAAVAIRDALHIDTSDDVRIYLPATALNDSDWKERVANDRFERSIAAKPDGRLLFDDLMAKADFIRTFAAVKDTIDIGPRHTVLELGASHGWASVMVKDDCPTAHVVVSDVVVDCVKHCRRYERFLGRCVDEKWAFSVRDIPFADAQFDRIFTFAAFHHFGDHGDYEQSMAEIGRVLKPGGKLVLLYEPTSPAFLYPFAHRRVNRKRAHEGVDEDVLVDDSLKRVAAALGMTMTRISFPFYHYRDSVATAAYYYLLAKTGLSRWMVCTANLIFEKR